jgi:MFS family permease
MKSSVPGAFAVFIMCTMFVYGAFSICQSYISGLLGAERGMGGAIQNSIGNLGGFVGPYVIVSMVKELTCSCMHDSVGGSLHGVVHVWQCLLLHIYSCDIFKSFCLHV